MILLIIKNKLKGVHMCFYTELYTYTYCSLDRIGGKIKEGKRYTALVKEHRSLWDQWHDVWLHGTQNVNLSTGRKMWSKTSSSSVGRKYLPSAFAQVPGNCLKLDTIMKMLNWGEG